MINKHKLMKLVEDKSGTYINIDEILSCFRYKDQYKVKISDLIKSEGPEEHDNEMSEYITDVLCEESVESLWTQNTVNYTGYQNDITWTFIELVAMSIVDGVDALEDDELYAVIA